MATLTYGQLQKQIAALEAQAARVKASEIAGVVARIKEAIASYGITPHDLFGAKFGAARGRKEGGQKAKGKPQAAPKYVDGKGGQWGGLGKRPRWLSEALAAGRKLEEFLAVKPATQASAPAASPADVSPPAAPMALKTSARSVKKGKPAKKVAGKIKYRDDAGNSWTGVGPAPKWLKVALESGKTREDFLVKS